MCIKISYLAESERSISSLLQKHIDHDWKKTKLFLILCGSSMSFMENQVLGYKSPLYGRRTAQFKIQPFTFFEAREMCPSFSLNEQAVIYGLTWGVPEYLKHFDGKKMHWHTNCFDWQFTHLHFVRRRQTSNAFSARQRRRMRSVCLVCVKLAFI